MLMKSPVASVLSINVTVNGDYTCSIILSIQRLKSYATFCLLNHFFKSNVACFMSMYPSSPWMASLCLCELKFLRRFCLLMFVDSIAWHFAGVLTGQTTHIPWDIETMGEQMPSEESICISPTGIEWLTYFTSNDPVGSLYIHLFKFVYRNKIHPP